MSRFRFSTTPLDTGLLRAELADPGCGGYASFEGWVRDHNEGQRVTRLEYEAFAPLALREGERVIAEAGERFGIRRALCVHRLGALELGAIAVWVGAAAEHRDEAFRACRYIIDEVKHRLPIWKKEHYQNGDSGWVNCERCATAGDPRAAPHAGPAAAHGHDHDRGHAHGPRR
jgi:molybdopterin synthase catalytic subunit